LLKESISWCINGMLTSTPMGTTFNGLYSLTQNIPQIGFHLNFPHNLTLFYISSVNSPIRCGMRAYSIRNGLPKLNCWNFGISGC
jgi:hypothetical protein